MRFAIDLDAYIQRVAYVGPLERDLATLQGLVRAHVTSIPVENIDPLMGMPVDLDPVAVEDKLVYARRGGSGFEQNVLLAEALVAIGFNVDRLMGRVLWERPMDARSSPSHMLLRVELDGQSWLVDGGFQQLTPPGPLSMRPDIEQMTSHETFRLLQSQEQWQLQVKISGCWKPLYRFDLRPHEAIDYTLASHYESTHPDSPLVSHLRVARLTAAHRFVLNDGRFTIESRDGSSEHCSLTRPSQVREILVNRFGLWLPRHGVLDQRLETLLGGSDSGEPYMARAGNRHLKLI